MTALYIRVSTLEQSTDSQEVELTSYCRRAGFKPIRVFKETISGLNDSRPVLNDLLTEVRKGKVDRVIVWKLDRLGRSLTHLSQIVNELLSLKVSLIVPSQGIDTSSNNPAATLQINILSAFAQFEGEIIRERTKTALQLRKARGMILGRPSFSQEIIQKCRSLRQKGLSYDAIASKLSLSKGFVHRVSKDV